MAEDEEEARKGERRGEQGRLGEGGGRVAACIGKLGRNNNGNIPHAAAQRGGKEKGRACNLFKILRTKFTTE